MVYGASSNTYSHVRLRPESKNGFGKCWARMELTAAVSRMCAQCQGLWPGAWCMGKTVPPPPVDILVVGTSCKDMSRISPYFKQSRTILRQDWSPGGSAQTFRGLLAYIDRCPPNLVIYENVDSMDEGSGETNTDILLSEFSSRGYEGQRMTLDAYSFGLPQHRRRMYVLFVRVVANSRVTFVDRQIDQVFVTFCACVSACQRAAPCASGVLLADDDPAVAAELERRRLEASGRVTEGAWSEAALKSHIDLYRSHGLRWGEATEGSLKSPWFATITPQQRGTLTFSQKKDPGDVLFRNIGQSAARVIMSTVQDGKHVAPTQLPSQLLWIEPGLAASGQVGSQTNVGRLLLGREALLFQGYPVPLVKEAVDTTSESLLADLAGNGMAVPVVLAILVSASISLSWRSSDFQIARQSTPEEMESATALLSTLASWAAAKDEANLRPKRAKTA